MSDLHDETWEWTLHAMQQLTEIADKARDASKRAVMLADKLALRSIETRAREGRAAVAKIFGEVK